MIITCPYCHTSYQVAREAIGSAGRQVQCAQCQRAWQAAADGENIPATEPPRAMHAVPEEKAFGEFEEQKLDEAIEDEARAVSQDWHAVSFNKQRPEKAKPQRADTAEDRKLQKEFSKRQVHISRKLPFARARRAVRMALLAVLAMLIVAAYALRVDIVRMFPDLAGVYAAVGLPVNVYGLEFRDLTTLRALRNGDEVLTLEARIYSASARLVPVPPVIVTLVDERGGNIYEWSVKPASADLAPGEFITFETQLIAPPAQAVRVRLAFAGSATPLVSAATPATTTQNVPTAPESAEEHAAPAAVKDEGHH